MGQHLHEVAGAVIGATALWFLGVPFLFEIFGPDEAIPGWFWFGVAAGVIASTMLTMLSRRIVRQEHQKA